MIDPFSAVAPLIPAVQSSMARGMPAKGERWWVKFPGGPVLQVCEILDTTLATIELRLVGAQAAYRYEKGCAEIKFVERLG